MTIEPAPGQLWQVTGPSGYGIYLGSGYWSILVRSGEEYTLTDTLSPAPVHLEAFQPEGMSWAEQFDALARAAGLGITWAEEVSRYREDGLAAASRALNFSGDPEGRDR
ncbi:hypothetical protein [Arthrobacter sp. IK3]|uniref:hypothetical protein n=1 Tax=Arthrobacter sp. IK3 TaxID=3448169 RepID=UPI003EE06450